MVPGPAFEDVQGQNIRPYPPVDLRLFSYHQGCYYFIGDPRDFGYTGQSYSYYGAHPVLDVYGGGWCFMMGGHYHLWRPWSPYFTVVGPWYYWYGPYDPFFWSYWPYYSFYYRSYYPSYYAGGRFYRGGGYRAAPPISRVPATAMRGSPPGMAAGGSNFRGSPPAGAGPSSQSGWRGSAPASGASSPAPFRSATPSTSSRFRLPRLAVGQRLRRRLARRRRPAPLIAVYRRRLLNVCAAAASSAAISSADIVADVERKRDTMRPSRAVPFATIRSGPRCPSPSTSTVAVGQMSTASAVITWSRTLRTPPSS